MHELSEPQWFWCLSKTHIVCHESWWNCESCSGDTVCGESWHLTPLLSHCHSRLPQSNRLPPLYLPLSLSPPPSLSRHHQSHWPHPPPSLQHQLHAATLSGDLGPGFLSTALSSLTTSFTYNPLSCTCPSYASLSNTLHKHSRTQTNFVCSINICWSCSAFTYKQVFISPSFSFSTVSVFTTYNINPVTKQKSEIEQS